MIVSLPSAESPRPTTPAPLRILALCVLAAVALVFALDTLFPLHLPDTQRDAATVVVARDGTPLRAFADSEGVWRYPVTIEDVSPLYIDAVLGYEDRWFWHHAGVNVFAFARAALQAAWHGELVSGGSTLTMQVARLIEPIPHSGIGKLRQIFRALQLEAHLSKREILTLYLNYAPFGGTLQGVQAASYGYLGKPASDLSHAEAALLAVLPQAPSRLRPDRNPAAAQAARDKVLARLDSQQTWPSAAVADARIEQVTARQLQPPLRAALLAQRLRSETPTQRRIESTLDADLQRRLETRVADWVGRLPPRTSAAVLVADTRTMQVRAYVGAARFGEAESFGHIDMVAAHRSPGSTLKPFLYGLALDEGLIHSESLLLDAPQDFDGYRPGNFDSRFHGPIGAQQALQQSLNVPAVALLQALGPQKFAARLAHGGLPLRLPRGAEPNLAMILGGTEARLEDLVGAFSALQRDGLAAAPRFRADDPLRERRLLSPGAAWIVREMLQSAPRPGEASDRFDTSRRSELAWKTGTSYGFRDAWAIGATGGAVIGVWIGRPDGTPLPGQYGAITSLPLLFAISDSLPRELRATATPMPASVAQQSICWPFGRLQLATPPEHCARHMDAWLLDGTVPPTLPTASTGDVPAPIAYRRDARSGARIAGTCTRTHDDTLASIAPWPTLAYPWLSPTERRNATLPDLAPDCTDAAAPRATLAIAGLVNGTVLRPPSNSSAAPQVALRALGTRDAVQWLVNGRLIGESRGDAPFLANFEDTGDLRVLALDARGRFAQIDVRVLR